MPLQATCEQSAPSSGPLTPMKNGLQYTLDGRLSGPQTILKMAVELKFQCP
jgi:hypothetical protein